MADPLDELTQFLKPDTRLDLKSLSLDHLLGLSSNQECVQTLLKNKTIISNVLALTDDKSEIIAKSALFFFVNISATEIGSKELLNYRAINNKNVIDTFVGYVLNPHKKYADAACMILSNITRVEDKLSCCIDTLFPNLKNLLNAFLDIDYNKKDSKLHYLAPMFSNLACSHKFREWLCDNTDAPLLKLLPFCNYESSNIRKGGVISTIKNLSFASKFHEFLLSPNVDLLTYLLKPIMGNEEYNDDEMDKLPINLQYLPKETERDSDVDVRKIILEILNRLCIKKSCRIILRANGVYYVLRELHKWEKDPSNLLVCENVVDILIREENEIGLDDLTSVDVPEDMKDKFYKMDDDYIKNCL